MRSKIVGLLMLLAVMFALLAWKSAVHPVNAQTKAGTPPDAAAASLLAQKNPAKLAQLMRGIMLPNSNVIFAAENKNPADIPPAKNASGAVNPLEGTYGQWEAVENSSLAIAETATLISVPGRVCSNGRPVPIHNADWAGLVDGVRIAGIKAYLAAQTKNQDKLADAGDLVTTACSNCHVKYRDTPKLEDRCK